MAQISIEYNLGGIEGLCRITPKKHGDSRGYFMESYNDRELREAGFGNVFVQDNQSRSSKGVLRGMHYQTGHPQAKIIRVLQGSIFDVSVDLREASATYGKWYGEILSGENLRQIFVPRGFAHGFLVLSESAEILYKCDDYYFPDDEGGIIWNDPDIGIEWPEKPLIISERDRNWPSLSELRVRK